MNNEIKKYIINLQEENQILKNQLDFIEEQNHIIDKLEKENERLKQANKILEENWLAYMKINQEAIEILHNINDTLPLDIILGEIEHSEYILQNGSGK